MAQKFLRLTCILLIALGFAQAQTLAQRLKAHNAATAGTSAVAHAAPADHSDVKQFKYTFVVTVDGTNGSADPVVEVDTESAPLDSAFSNDQKKEDYHNKAFNSALDIVAGQLKKKYADSKLADAVQNHKVADGN